MTSSCALASFDFVGVTERFDESVVAMTMLLLGLPLANVLCLKAKGTGGGLDNVCRQIQPLPHSRCH